MSDRRLLNMAAFCLVLAILMLIWATFARAADVPLAWDASSGATGYQVQMSIDQGKTWSEPQDAGDKIGFTWNNAPDHGLLLFRVLAYNAAGVQAVRLESGAWYDGDFKPPQTPGGLGIKSTTPD